LCGVSPCSYSVIAGDRAVPERLSCTDRVTREPIAVGAQQLRVAHRQGDGVQPPLLLIGGFMSSIEVLDPFVAALRSTSGVVVCDVPGIGRSPGARRAYRLSWLAGVLGGVLDALGHQRADVLGVSWGGALAQQFAYQEPSRCRQVRRDRGGHSPGRLRNAR
jgi:pimeloyl-ACP methyl ester carboxylesterase